MADNPTAGSGFPSAEELQRTMRRLAEVEATDYPVLSIYLDMRPQASGQAPGRRASLTLLRDRLRDIEQTYWPRGADYDSFKADEERLLEYLQTDFDPAAEGLAVFACSGIGVWETVLSGVGFDDSVSAGSRPDLFQLARMVDTHETAVVALVDSNTARLFVTRSGQLEEVGGPDEDPVSFRRRSTGGWSQARYQRHIDKHISQFARETAEAIRVLTEQTRARRLFLAGDEVAVTPLVDALPKAVEELVEDVLRVDMRASHDELDAEVRAALERAEAASGASVADELVAAVRSGGLGVVGADQTRRALEAGAVAVLVLSDLDRQPAEESSATDARPLDERAGDIDERNELVRLAVATSAEVEVVSGHEQLDRAGGVGALLRYQM